MCPLHPSNCACFHTYIHLFFFYCCLFFFSFFHPFLYPQKVALAQFPELSPSERDLGIFRNQQAVSCSAKSSAEIQPFTTDRHSGETHRHHQTRLELVRKHILIHTNSYIVTHFLNNPQDCSSRHVPLLKNELLCTHIDVSHEVSCGINALLCLRQEIKFLPKVFFNGTIG